MPEGFLRRPDVAKRVGYSPNHLNKMVALGQFPEPRLVGKRAIRWLESEVDEWMKTRPKVSAVERVRPGVKSEAA